jgi:acetyl esterase/lipase
MQHFLAYAFGEDESEWREASPQHVSRTTGHSTAPWLVWHSCEDELLNTVQSSQFAERLTTLGVPVRYHEEAKGGKHWDGVHSLACPGSPLATLIVNFVVSCEQSKQPVGPSAEEEAM